jgi:hypothetical protein
VMKRKLKRDSATPSLSSDYAASLEEPNGLRSPSPTKASFILGPTSNTRDGGWKKATGVMSSNGYFKVFSEVSFISNFFDEYDAKILSQTFRIRICCTLSNYHLIVEQIFESSINLFSMSRSASLLIDALQRVQL